MLAQDLSLSLSLSPTLPARCLEFFHTDRLVVVCRTVGSSSSSLCAGLLMRNNNNNNRIGPASFCLVRTGTDSRNREAAEHGRYFLAQTNRAQAFGLLSLCNCDHNNLMERVRYLLLAQTDSPPGLWVLSLCSCDHNNLMEREPYHSTGRTSWHKQTAQQACGFVSV